MVNSMPASLKWLLFTFLTTIIMLVSTGISILTMSALITGLLFSIGYLYKDEFKR